MLLPVRTPTETLRLRAYPLRRYPHRAAPRAWLAETAQTPHARSSESSGLHHAVRAPYLQARPYSPYRGRSPARPVKETRDHGGTPWQWQAFVSCRARMCERENRNVKPVSSLQAVLYTALPAFEFPAGARTAKDSLWRSIRRRASPRAKHTQSQEFRRR